MNLGQLQADVERRLEETQGSPLRWSTQDITDAINEGLQELSDATEFFERYFTLSLNSATTFYDLRTCCPDTILRVTAIFNPTNNLWLRPTDVWELDYRTARQWELVQGEPQKYHMRGLWWFGIYPAGPSTQGILRLYYRGIHPNLVTIFDEPQQLPADYHFLLVDYACYTLLADDLEMTQAMQFWNRYKQGEAALAMECSPGGRIGRSRVGGTGFWR